MIVTLILIVLFLLLFSMPFVRLVLCLGPLFVLFYLPLSSSLDNDCCQGYLLSIHWTAKNRLSFYICTRKNCAYLTMHKRQMTKE